MPSHKVSFAFIHPTPSTTPRPSHPKDTAPTPSGGETSETDAAEHAKNPNQIAYVPRAVTSSLLCSKSHRKHQPALCHVQPPQSGQYACVGMGTPAIPARPPRMKSHCSAVRRAVMNPSASPATDASAPSPTTIHPSSASPFHAALPQEDFP